MKFSCALAIIGLSLLLFLETPWAASPPTSPGRAGSSAAASDPNWYEKRMKRNKKMKADLLIIAETKVQCPLYENNPEYGEYIEGANERCINAFKFLREEFSEAEIGNCANSIHARCKKGKCIAQFQNRDFNLNWHEVELVECTNRIPTDE